MLSNSRNAFKLTNWLRLALAALVVYVGMAGYLAPATVAEAAATVVRIDAGSPTSYRDSQGQLWSADTAFVGGRPSPVVQSACREPPIQPCIRRSIGV
jgi:hypothetical protein